MPPLVDFLPALGPAVVLASLRWRPPAGGSTRAAELHLAAWATTGLLLLLVQPVPYPLQFMVGLGLPVLTLAAIGLQRWPVAATWAALLALGTTALAASRLVWHDNPRWHVPAARIEAALLLRPSCTRADLALAPPDIGLYTAGLTACRVFVGHPAARGHAEREQQARAFYAGGDPAARGAWLDQAGITRLVLPGDAGDVPETWLGAGTPFRRIGRAGAPPADIGLYARGGASP
jgi:hypothetical protein